MMTTEDRKSFLIFLSTVVLAVVIVFGGVYLLLSFVGNLQYNNAVARYGQEITEVCYYAEKSQACFDVRFKTCMQSPLEYTEDQCIELIDPDK